MNEINLKSEFEDNCFLSHNMTYWWGKWYADLLAYKSEESFLGVLSKARQFCDNLSIDIQDNFRKTKVYVDSELTTEYCLSLFGCYLIAMHADSRKPEVKLLRQYFENSFSSSQLLISQLPEIEHRLKAREQLREAYAALNKAVSRAGIDDFSTFTNTAYEGFYASNASKLRALKQIPDSKPYFDYVGHAELLANIFRVVLTKESLLLEQKGQAEKAIEINKRIAKAVRNIVKNNIGKYPEELPVEQNLQLIIRELQRLCEKMNSAKMYFDYP